MRGGGKFSGEPVPDLASLVLPCGTEKVGDICEFFIEKTIERIYLKFGRLFYCTFKYYFKFL